jgi:O-antigen/teichoic acid export membrane protein
VFWVAAARLYDAHTVGRDVALIAAMIELSVICQLNLTNGVTRFLPSVQRAARTLLGVYAVSGAAALIVGTGFVVIAPIASHQFQFLRNIPALAVTYVMAQVLWTWFSLQDAALAAMRQAPWILVENGVFGVLKLAALILLLVIGAANGVFLASVLPIVFLLVPVNLFLFRTAIPQHVRTRRPSTSMLQSRPRQVLLRFMAQDYGATVLAQTASTALPVLVVALVGSKANAYFYVPYTIVISFTLLFFGACTSLVVEGGRAEHQIRALATRIARLFTFTAVPGVVVMIVAAPVILLPFGPEYARVGTPLLRILACGCLFRIISFLYIAIARVQGRGLRILAVNGGQGILLVLGVSVLAGSAGLQGVAISWVAATAIAAVAILPSLIRFLRSNDETPRETPPAPRVPDRIGVHK